MRAMLPRLIAAATAVTLALSGAVSPAHSQEIAQTETSRATASSGSLVGAKLLPTNKDSAELTWRSSAGTLLTRLDSTVYLNGIPQRSAADSVTTRREGATEIFNVRSIDHAAGSNTGIEVLRTYRIDGTTATLDVTLRNTTSREQRLQVDLRHAGVHSSPNFTAMSADNTLVATTTRPDYTVSVDFDGNPQATGFSGDGTWPDVAYGVDGAKGQRGSGSARYQNGRWFKPLQPGETFTGSISVTAVPAVRPTDADGDGIPDEWERHGFKPTPNEHLDFPRWGASPDTRDVFLQLNWMQPEVDSKSCAPGGRYARTPRGYTDFLECAEANKNEYRPSKKALRDLIDLFKDKGINLHIDAGEWFNTFTTNPAEMKGGPTVPYRVPYYASEDTISPTLFADRADYLGARDGIFRLGIIGDQLLAGDYSSGVSTTPGGSFYVAKQFTMTSDEQVRNTILHELGHNLGLTHAGTSTVPANHGLSNLPNYLSTMNYLYQFSHFGYSDREYRDGGALPLVCLVKTCYEGPYTVPADWDNLLLADGLGRFAIPDTDQHDHHQEDSTVRDLEVIAADKNSGKGGFRLTQDPDIHNGIIPALPANAITGEITNRGRKEQTFILEATYPGGPMWRERFRVEGIPEDLPEDDSTNPTAGKLPVTIPIEVDRTFTGSSLPVTIRLFNAAGVEQFNETFSIPVLDYTAEDISNVLTEVLADPTIDPKVKQAAEQALASLGSADGDSGDSGDAGDTGSEPKPGTNPGTDPWVNPPAPGTTTTPPLPGEEGLGWKIPLIVLGSLLGLVGLIEGLRWIWEQFVEF